MSSKSSTSSLVFCIFCTYSTRDSQRIAFSIDLTIYIITVSCDFRPKKKLSILPFDGLANFFFFAKMLKNVQDSIS